MDTVTYSFHVFYQVNWGYLSIILDKISTVQPQLRANMYSFIVDTAEESLKERKKTPLNILYILKYKSGVQLWLWQRHMMSSSALAYL